MSGHCTANLFDETRDGEWISRREPDLHLTVRADQGDRTAARQLTELLVREGRTDEAVTSLHARAGQGDLAAARQLAELLVREGRTDELRARAEQGDSNSG